MQDRESDTDRVNRELMELLNELRVALPGVQVLFAFLLVVAFQPRFAQITAFQRDAYFGSLLCAAGATACLIAPSAYHRLNFRASIQEKERIVRSSNSLAIGGLVLLSLSMTGAVLLVTDFLFGTIAAVVFGCAVAGAFAWLWFALPLTTRVRQSPD